MDLSCFVPTSCSSLLLKSRFIPRVPSADTIYKFAKDKYSKRFPELETLVVQPLEYLMAAKELGNDVLKAKNNKVLEQFLTQATIMVVSVTASTTQGYLVLSQKITILPAKATSPQGEH